MVCIVYILILISWTDSLACKLKYQITWSINHLGYYSYTKIRFILLWLCNGSIFLFRCIKSCANKISLTSLLTQLASFKTVLFSAFSDLSIVSSVFFLVMYFSTYLSNSETCIIGMHNLCAVPIISRAAGPLEAFSIIACARPIKLFDLPRSNRFGEVLNYQN